MGLPKSGMLACEVIADMSEEEKTRTFDALYREKWRLFENAEVWFSPERAAVVDEKVSGAMKHWRETR
jgi:hypothetical protein